jgi:hypothetical protein
MISYGHTSEHLHAKRPTENITKMINDEHQQQQPNPEAEFKAGSKRLLGKAGWPQGLALTYIDQTHVEKRLEHTLDRLAKMPPGDGKTWLQGHYDRLNAVYMETLRVHAEEDAYRPHRKRARYGDDKADK